MPAVYAHYRFGAKVSRKLPEDLRKIVTTYHPQFTIGLQGPDIFFFYRPYRKNRIARYGNHLHEIPAREFFEHGVRVVKGTGRESGEYAYLLGFLCHFILDSECHPYVSEMIGETGVQHLEIEEELEKALLRKDGKDPFSYETARLIPADRATASAIRPFYQGISCQTVEKSLHWMRRIKALFTAPGKVKFHLVNGLLKTGVAGRYPSVKGLICQREDNPRCAASNQGLEERFAKAVEVAVAMTGNLDEAVKSGACLSSRFDRTFE